MSDDDGTYRTVAASAGASFAVRGSEFIAHVAPADSVDAAEAFVERVRETYADATHNVPAYRVREGDSAEPCSANRSSAARRERSERLAANGAERPVSGRRPRDSTLGSGMVREYSSDDGEPSGSAGKPALNVLQGRGVENVVCVVTRYYGGTNLRIGGLVRAYGRATKEAIDAAGVIEDEPHEQATVTVAYGDSGTVRSVLESESVEFDASYEAAIRFDVRVPVADAETLYDRLRSATSGRADRVIGDHRTGGSASTLVPSLSAPPALVPASTLASKERPRHPTIGRRALLTVVFDRLPNDGAGDASPSRSVRCTRRLHTYPS